MMSFAQYASGIGAPLLIVICGLTSALAGLSGYLYTPLRHVETLLPDHDSAVSA